MEIGDIFHGFNIDNTFRRVTVTWRFRDFFFVIVKL